MATSEYQKEEHYLLRIHDTQAAERLRGILTRPPGEASSDLQLKFDSEPFLNACHNYTQVSEGFESIAARSGSVKGQI